MIFRLFATAAFTFAFTVCLMDRAHGAGALPPVDDTMLIFIIGMALVLGIGLGTVATLSIIRKRERRAFDERVRRAARSGAQLYRVPSNYTPSLSQLNAVAQAQSAMRREVRR